MNGKRLSQMSFNSHAKRRIKVSGIMPYKFQARNLFSTNTLKSRNLTIDGGFTNEIPIGASCNTVINVYMCQLVSIYKHPQSIIIWLVSTVVNISHSYLAYRISVTSENCYVKRRKFCLK